VTQAPLQPPRGLTHEALWPGGLLTQGTGGVIIELFKSGGRRVETGVFLRLIRLKGWKQRSMELNS